MIPYGRQEVLPADIDAVVEVLRSDFITQGPVVPKFEEAVAAYCGAKYAVAVTSGTAALHIACLTMDLAPGDRLWTVPNTFVASANCGLYCGADIDFVDIDPATRNMSVVALREKLEAAEARGKLPRIVIPVHFGGHSCEMTDIQELAERYGFCVLEDACHAIGGWHQGTPVGACDHSDAAVFSFHPVKNITTGEGGVLLTNREDVAERARRLRTHGITRDPTEMSEGGQGRWYYEQIDLGYNYRMTDMQAALGLSQLQRLDDYVERRGALARRYDHSLADLPVRRPVESDSVRSAWHLYVVSIEDGEYGGRDAVFERMVAAGIGVNVHYLPVHLQPVYRRRGFAPGDFPEAERHGRQALTLPLFPNLTETDQDCVAEALADALRS